jgi:Mn2+/Fe2+ NRAMP family transporter
MPGDPQGAPSGPPASRRTLAGAAFLMATSAIGPGFLTQTAVFTERHGRDFAFAILASVLLALVVQWNVWPVLVASGRRGPELASAVVPGLGRLLAVLVTAGGLVFNVGNVAGCGLGLLVFGIPTAAGATVSALVVAAVVAAPRAGAALDTVTRVLGTAMILATLAVAAATQPDAAGAAIAAVAPSSIAVLPVLTLLGGTVGGYIPFSGAHRLLDAGLRGGAAVPAARRSATLGVAVAAAMRVLFFLAVLGVLSRGVSLDPANPPASAFRLGAGEWGYRLFGLVLWSAALTSVVGCTYTSVSFAESAWPRAIAHRRGVAIAAFVAVSLAVFLVLGRPVRLLVLAGALNGLVLPVTLLVALLAARRPDLTGGAYAHPRWLTAGGWLALALATAAAVLGLGEIGRLWRA